MNQEIKICTKCGLDETKISFYSKNNKNNSWCKSCISKNAKDTRSLRHRTIRNGYLRRKYNITINQYEQMLENQNNVCAIYKNSCSLHKYLSVNHDHRTGKVRGLLCNEYNFGLAKFKDNPSYLENGISYLKSRNSG